MKQRIAMKGSLALALLIGGSVSLSAQNVGIGIAAPLQKLHVSDATLPNAATIRVSGLSSTTTLTAGTGPFSAVMVDANGVMYRGGTVGSPPNAWMTTGNAGTNGGNTTTPGTNFLGTTDNQNIDVRTNNLPRARFSALGEFFVGALNTVLVGDLMNGVGNVTFPWALNGYTDQDGAGTYGRVTAGTTIYAGVQGEYNGTNAQGAGVRGISIPAVGGTSFAAVHTGVSGNATSGGSYKFGVYGSGGTDIRSGGVMGYDYGFGVGALGYYGSSTLDYSVYGFGVGFTTGVAGGKQSGQQPIEVGMDRPNTHVGLGIYGGVMGGWVRGMRYGMHVKGDRTSLYVDGSTYTNQPIAQLVATDNGARIATYVPSSTTADVYARGKTKMANGQIYVRFDENFRQIIQDPQQVTITVTPTGNSNGVYVSAVDEGGFWVKENNNGQSNVDLSWIAVGVRKGSEAMTVSPEILDADFDAKMNAVMHNDNSPEAGGSVWWDGKEMRFDAPPAKQPSEDWKKYARPMPESGK